MRVPSFFTLAPWGVILHRLPKVLAGLLPLVLGAAAHAQADAAQLYGTPRAADVVVRDNGDVLYTLTAPERRPELVAVRDGAIDEAETARFAKQLGEGLQLIRCVAWTEQGLAVLEVRDGPRSTLVAVGPNGEVLRLGGEGSTLRFIGLAKGQGAVHAVRTAGAERALVRIDLAGGAETVLRTLSGGHPVGSVSASEVFATQSVWNGPHDDDVFVVHLPSGRSINFTERRPATDDPVMQRADHGGGVLVDGPDEVLVTSNLGRDRTGLLAIGLNDAQSRTLYEPEADIDAVVAAAVGPRVLVRVRSDAGSTVAMVDRNTGLVRSFDLPRGDATHMAIAPGGRFGAVALTTDTAPARVWRLDLDTGSAELLPLPESARASHEQLGALVAAEPVSYESYDGSEIPGLLYLPDGRSEPRPAVVWVHGGPGGESRHRYNATIQLLVRAGYAVFAVNHRGSSGYGRAFYHADDRAHGQADLDDLVWADRYLARRDDIDEDRIAVLGASYGGYLALSALTLRPEVFDAGISVAGVTDWLRILQSVQGSAVRARAELFDEFGDPVEHAERLKSVSPIDQAFRITKPMLVIQGGLDRRVPRVESDRLVAEARRAGAEVEYLVFPDEGHGVRKITNRVTAVEAYLAFLEKHIGPAR